MFRARAERASVLLNGGGFDGPPWSVRVSLANLAEQEYENIGAFMKEAAAEYVEAWKSGKAGKRVAPAGARRAAARTTRRR